MLYRNLQNFVQLTEKSHVCVSVHLVIFWLTFIMCTLCMIKHLFVALQDSSVYICILMDYFPKGTLDDLLDRYREKAEAIPEEVRRFIKKYYWIVLNSH